ncbi:MAG: DUF1576 domain-containing protein [Proteobacteria bacterium]|nr:DUF1576 domain-containing protein [Pseudomonadota bacterium]
MALTTLPPAPVVSERAILATVAAVAAAFVAFGFGVDSPAGIARGLVAIVTSRDTLLTDYFGVGGMGAACVNAGLLALCACAIFRASGARVTGASVASLCLVLGFGLFGKNLLNVWPLLAGVGLYARFNGERFADHANTAFFGLALAPIVSEILFSTTLPWTASVPLAAATGIAIGFVLPPVAAQAFKAHMGFSLYNMGFAAGLLGTLVVALYKAVGFVADPVFIWTTGNTRLLGVFLALLFGALVACGFAFDRTLVRGLRTIVALPGQAPTDFIARAGFGATLANMGLCGFVGLAYVFAVGGPLNGPVIGALLTIVGFAAAGKHPRNVVPVMVGVFVGTLATRADASGSGLLLAALFGTTLAPIAGRFGWAWGIVAGVLHASAAQTVGPLHAGLNLYNNGFAAGIVATILVPVIIAVRLRTVGDDGARRDG